MFAVLYTTEDGSREFRICDTYEEAQQVATDAACGLGCEVTVFDYDADSKTFCEWYII